MSSRREERHVAQRSPDAEVGSAQAQSQTRDERRSLAVVGPGRPGPSRSGQLPAQPTAIVGRTHDIDAARAEIVERGARLVTLSGPPGVGKTRLAVEIAEELAERFEHGAWFVDLAPVTDPHQVAAMLSHALGIWEGGRTGLDVALHGFLRDRQALILLDNFEQVVDAAPLLAALLAACPRLVFLVTSRTGLRIRWEHELPVAPLELPNLQADPGAQRLADNPAIALFVDRARAIRPGFRLTDQTSLAIAQICVRLDGLPLAIELAASHVKLLSPGAILDHLNGARSPAEPTRSSLGLLTNGARDLPDRQRTLRDAIAWSYRLLSPSERAVFRRLAVFPGSFSLDTAIDVAGENGIETANVVSSLIDQSLVRREGGSDGEPRFRLLQTLREYAHEQLDASGERPAIQRRLAAFYVELGAEAHDGLWGRDQARWLERLELDLDNIRAVLDWSVGADGDLEAGLLLLRGVCRLWDVRGHLAEGRVRANALLARAAEVPGPRSSYHVSEGEAYTSLVAGVLAFDQGDFAASSEHARRGMQLSRQIGFTFGETTALFGLASMAHVRGDTAEAEALIEQALAVARAAGDGRSLYHILYWRGEGARLAGEYDRAVQLLEECLSLNRAHGNPWHAAMALFTLGHVALIRDDTDRAWELLTESLSIRRQIGDRMGIALVVEALAWIATANRQHERAACLFGAASALRERIGGSVQLSWSSDHQRFLEQTRAALDDRTFSTCWSQGETLTPDDVIDLALHTAPATGPAQRHHRALPSGVSGTAALLTPRERETVRLIARGLSNREIAAELVISHGAAANYVQRVFARLGFHTRAQVATWAVEHGLGPGADTTPDD